ncbi:MAG TPA: 23S rRNA (pseudouridine(1915)-N(3))-methyltransferase RlmH [Myxococcota bacterium]|nr:23S rRNA (pseudouridine(1915)-N(3))-methyltransferase RlmH [Myxococcota bacterium]
MPVKAPKDPCIILGHEYLNRARSFYKAEALFFDARGSLENDQEKRKIFEGELLLKKTEKTFRLALSERGKQFSTEQFAQFLEKKSTECRDLSFIIGGAFGLSNAVLAQSDAILSLSAMTLPHRLAFLIICEQLYRASEIKRGSPYHK